MKVKVTKSNLDIRAFIHWTRRNFKGTEGDIILLLLDNPRGLTTEELFPRFYGNSRKKVTLKITVSILTEPI